MLTRFALFVGLFVCHFIRPARRQVFVFDAVVLFNVESETLPEFFPQYGIALLQEFLRYYFSIKLSAHLSFSLNLSRINDRNKLFNSLILACNHIVVTQNVPVKFALVFEIHAVDL